MPKVVILDANSRVSLTIVRALGLKGLNVVVVGVDGWRNFCFKSKYSKKNYTFVDYRSNPEGYLDSLISILNKDDVVIPVSINTILFISKHQERLRGVAKFLLPDVDKIDLVNNKANLANLAKELDIPHPRTFILSSLDELSKLNGYLNYPLIIKFRVDQGLYFYPRKRYKIVENKEQLIKSYKEMAACQELPVIQEVVNGDSYAVSMLVDADSNIKASFMHKRIRTYPYRGGPSSLCESCYKKELVDCAKKIVNSIKWKGIINFEFKYDEVSGKFYLIEINPRFWGSLSLAIESDINFPYLLYLILAGKQFDSNMDYQLNKRMRFLVQDMLSATEGIIAHGDLKCFCRFVKDIFSPSIREGTLQINDIKGSLAYLKSKIL